VITRCTIPADVACASVEDGTVLLHMGTKRYYSLNETGAAIWRMLEQDVPVAEIPRRLSAEFDVTVGDAELAVDELLSSLARQELLAIEVE
jgi:Coenzyme PQQ synthesis protein D (PqqD)